MASGSKQSRRIVPKKAYARNLSQKAAVASTGVGLLAISLLAMVMAVGILVALVSAVVAHILPFELSLLLFACTAFLGSGGFFILHLGRRTIREAKEIEAGVPLTRANIGELPVRESLVRASDEPIQELQTVLLRAATSTDTTPVEQLVRAYQEPVLEEQDPPLQQETHTMVTNTISTATEVVEQRLSLQAGNNTA